MGNINYSAVLDDLETKKAELEAAIATIKNLVTGSGNAGGESGGVISPENIPVGAFLRLSIADATKRFLDMVKTKQTVPQIIKALERGGLPPAKYQTVYAVLRRRESQFGDIIRFGDEWALSEWYPNNPSLRKRVPSEPATKGKKKTTAKGKAKKPATASKKATARKSPDHVVSAASSEIKTPDAAEKVLTDAGAALELNVITERLHADFGKKLNSGLLKGMMARDPKDRFVNTSETVWDLTSRTEK